MKNYDLAKQACDHAIEYFTEKSSFLDRSLDNKENL